MSNQRNGYVKSNNKHIKIQEAINKFIPNGAVIYATMLVCEYDAGEVEEFKKDMKALMSQPSDFIAGVCQIVNINNKQIDLSQAEDELIKRNHCPALTSFALNVDSADKNKIAEIVLNNKNTSPEDLCKFATAIPNRFKYSFMDKVIESKKTKLNYECAKSEAESITGKTLDILKDKTRKKYVEKCLTVIAKNAKNNDDQKIIGIIEKDENLSPYWDKLDCRPTLPPM